MDTDADGTRIHRSERAHEALQRKVCQTLTCGAARCCEPVQYMTLYRTGGRAATRAAREIAEAAGEQGECQRHIRARRQEAPPVRITG